MNPKQANRLIGSLGIVILLFGAAARLRQYAFDRSLWFDEATLALNIIGRSFSALVRPLDYHQGAPIGFLWAQKAFITALGNGDLVLRLFPLAAGIGSLFLMRSLVASAGTSAKRLAGLLALLLFAVSGQLIYYSSEAKQYSVDVLVTLILLVAARRCFRPQASIRDLTVLGAAGIVSTWMSHPAIFVIVGIWAGLFVHQKVGAVPKRFSLLIVLVAAQAASFGVLYLVALRPLAANTYLLQYWQAGFMPFPPGRNLAWFPNALEDTLAGVLELSPALSAAALIVVGFGSLLQRKRPVAAGLIVSVACLLAASGLEKYPLSGRLVLFAAPAVYLLAAEGVWCLYRALSRMHRPGAFVVAAVAAVMLLYGPTLNTANKLLHPYTHDEIKPVMSYLQRRRAPKDAIYVYWRAVAAFTYYAPFYDVSSVEFTPGAEGGSSVDAYGNDISRFGKAGRIWLVFVDRCSTCKLDEQTYLRRLDALGKRLDQFRGDGAAAFLYSLPASSQPVP